MILSHSSVLLLFCHFINSVTYFNACTYTTCTLTETLANERLTKTSSRRKSLKTIQLNNKELSLL